MKITNKTIKAYRPENNLEKKVKSIIVCQTSDYENPEDFFKELFNHGCVSGMIGELIYYHDTHAFYIKYIEEIEELRDELEESQGEPVNPPKDQDRLNWLAWFGFEETTRKIYQKLGGEDY